MHRRLVEAFELQPRIARLPLARVAVERRLVGGREIVADRGACGLCLHQHETPWLRQADRRRMGSKRQQMRDEGGIDAIAAKTAHVAPPAHQLG